MLLNNLLLAITLTVLWPLGLMGVLAAAEWLERRTLATAEAVPRRLRPAADAPGETTAVMPPAAPAETVQDDDAATTPWPAAGMRPVSLEERADAADGERLLARRPGGGRHLRRAGGGRGGGRHERRG